jgi:hypothetical protein
MQSKQHLSGCVANETLLYKTPAEPESLRGKVEQLTSFALEPSRESLKPTVTNANTILVKLLGFVLLCSLRSQVPR